MVILKKTLSKILPLILLFGISSCSLHRHSVKDSNKQTQYTVKDEKEIERNLERKLHGEEKKIIEEAFEWLETPYVYGRQDKGVATDCSGFVMKTYEKAIGCKLPRNSAKQSEFCEKISKSKIRPGDLVFFITNGGDKINHVGIMIDENQFIHASSKGVKVSSMESDYYKNHLVNYGRVPCMNH